MNGRAPSLFISYRRQDTQWIARQLHRYLSQRLGSPSVFMDCVEIRGGDKWRTAIDVALENATVLLAIIGPQWLKVTNGYGRLRIDDADDWVRKEIRTALDQDKTIIPLYIDQDQPITDRKSLPTDIASLIDQQSIVLSENQWDRGLVDLVRRIEQCGFALHSSTIALPERRKKVVPLSKVELDNELRDLPQWSVTTTYYSLGHLDPPIPRTELYREYRFQSFIKATRFMAATSPMIDEGQHHPRWENIWTTVRVWLSTWDIEFQPSSYDVALARKLDHAYTEFVRKKT